MLRYDMRPRDDALHSPNLLTHSPCIAQSSKVLGWLASVWQRKPITGGKRRQMKRELTQTAVRLLGTAAALRMVMPKVFKMALSLEVEVVVVVVLVVLVVALEEQNKAMHAREKGEAMLRTSVR